MTKQMRLTPTNDKDKKDRWAENLILQLPADHDGRNSWLINFGQRIEARELRAKYDIKFDPAHNNEPCSDGVDVVNKYKIHGLMTANGLRRSNNTNKFYPTYEDAFAMAERCVKQNGNSIVIYEAIQVVEVDHPPIAVRNVL
jgi:hypothetical protein